MGRLCERPGCSEPGAASYGMVPEDLLFWVDRFHPTDGHDTGVLCRRHADAMVVPRGWTLDDRREPNPRLFRQPTGMSATGAGRPRRRRSVGAPSLADVEQLDLLATGVDTDQPGSADMDAGVAAGDASHPWVPEFDADDDLDGLLQVDSPLLARAFRGTGRVR